MAQLRHSLSLNRIEEEQPFLLLEDAQRDIDNDNNDDDGDDDDDDDDSVQERQRECFHQWVGTLSLSCLIGFLMGLAFCVSYWSNRREARQRRRSTPHNATNTTSSHNNNNNNNNSTIWSLQDVQAEDSYSASQAESLPSSLLSLPPLQQESICEATIMLLRHCEKTGPSVVDDQGNEHCSRMGKIRNLYLAGLFGTRWPMPTQLYAKSVHRSTHDNYRQVETLQILAQRANLTIEAKYANERPLANSILQHFYQTLPCNQVIVIAWKHSGMNALAQALGWEDAPSIYPKDSYDEVWQLQFVFQEKGGVTGSEDDDDDDSGMLQNDDDDDAIEVDANDDDDAMDSYNSTKKHRHKKKTKKKSKKSSIQWVVYGTVTQQNFDPLAYSYHQKRQQS